MRLLIFCSLLFLCTQFLTAQEPTKYKKPTIRLEIGSIFEDFHSDLKIEDDYGILTGLHYNFWQKLYGFAEYRRTESRFDYLLNPTLSGPVDVNTYVAGVYGYYRVLEEILEDLLISPHVGVGLKRFTSTLYPDQNDTAPLYTIGLSFFIIEPYSHMYVRTGLSFETCKTSFNQRNSTTLSNLLTFLSVGIEF